MKLKELKAKALELKSENDRLKEEVNAKKKVYAGVLKKNFEDIVFPYVREMNAFIYNMKCAGLDRTEHLAKCEAFDFMITSAPQASGIRLWLKEWKADGLDCYLDYGKSVYGKLQEDDWILLADFFATVDSCDAFIRKLNEWYVVLLSKAIEKFEAENPSLAETLRELTEKVSKASCMEEKENDTVEIHLGGKTYTAVLKEE